ncbi:uncharacterized protein METZ01_LOCUS287819 [marine metagenome]|uniref:Uncharacterized protein n=1 Tax=marine metagenome TaxID=408172 RepID=A0A382LGH4_9ZZZZ
MTVAKPRNSSTRRCPQFPQQSVEQINRKEHDHGTNNKDQQHDCNPFHLLTPTCGSSRTPIVDHTLSAYFISIVMLMRLTRPHNTLCLAAHIDYLMKLSQPDTPR